MLCIQYYRNILVFCYFEKFNSYSILLHCELIKKLFTINFSVFLINSIVLIVSTVSTPSLYNFFAKITLPCSTFNFNGFNPSLSKGLTVFYQSKF